jgi:hypothetical protein
VGDTFLPNWEEGFTKRHPVAAGITVITLLYREKCNYSTVLGVFPHAIFHSSIYTYTHTTGLPLRSVITVIPAAKYLAR